MVERTRSNGPQGAFLQAGKKFSSLQKLHSGPLIAPVPVGQIFWTMHAAEPSPVRLRPSPVRLRPSPVRPKLCSSRERRRRPRSGRLQAARRRRPRARPGHRAALDAACKLHGPTCANIGCGTVPYTRERYCRRCRPRRPGRRRPGRRGPPWCGRLAGPPPRLCLSSPGASRPWCRSPAPPPQCGIGQEGA